MATALEYGYAVAVKAAMGVRQGAYAAAFTTYAPNGFGVVANYAAYIAALVAADVVYWAAVNTAATTAGISTNTVDDLNGVYGLTASILT